MTSAERIRALLDRDDHPCVCASGSEHQMSGCTAKERIARVRLVDALRVAVEKLEAMRDDDSIIPSDALAAIEKALRGEK
jgi:hypothetical protein